MSLRSVDAVRRLRILWARLNIPMPNIGQEFQTASKIIGAVSLFLKNVQRE
jgi:hypothetical protein